MTHKQIREPLHRNCFLKIFWPDTLMWKSSSIDPENIILLKNTPEKNMTHVINNILIKLLQTNNQVMLTSHRSELVGCDPVRIKKRSNAGLVGKLISCFLFCCHSVSGGGELMVFKMKLWIWKALLQTVFQSKPTRPYALRCTCSTLATQSHNSQLSCLNLNKHN